MSETVIFVVGIIVFAITVYGTVMSGGTMLTRVQIEQNPKLKERVDDEDELNKRLPINVKY